MFVVVFWQVKVFEANVSKQTSCKQTKFLILYSMIHYILKHQKSRINKWEKDEANTEVWLDLPTSSVVMLGDKKTEPLVGTFSQSMIYLLKEKVESWGCICPSTRSRTVGLFCWTTVVCETVLGVGAIFSVFRLNPILPQGVSLIGQIMGLKDLAQRKESCMTWEHGKKFHFGHHCFLSQTSQSHQPDLLYVFFC